MNKLLLCLFLFAFYTEGVTQTTKPAFQGQAPIAEKVDTRNHAIIHLKPFSIVNLMPKPWFMTWVTIHQENLRL